MTKMLASSAIKAALYFIKAIMKHMLKLSLESFDEASSGR